MVTWAVIRGAKQLGINLLTLNSGEIPNLIKWVQLQLAHISDKTTNIYIVTAILLLTPKRSGPVLHSNIAYKGKNIKYFYFWYFSLNLSSYTLKNNK